MTAEKILEIVACYHGLLLRLPGKNRNNTNISLLSHYVGTLALRIFSVVAAYSEVLLGLTDAAAACSAPTAFYFEAAVGRSVD
jgi:hypothetical protein